MLKVMVQGGKSLANRDPNGTFFSALNGLVTLLHDIIYDTLFVLLHA